MGKPLVCKALQEPLVALVADGGDRPVAADNGNAPVPAGKQKTGRAPSGGGIVDAHAGQVSKVQVICKCGGQHAGHGNGGKACLKAAGVAAQENEPQRFALALKLLAHQHLIGVLVQVMDLGAVPGAGNKALHPFQNGGEKHVERALHHNDDAEVLLYLQLAGIAVGHEFMRRDDGLDLFLGLTGNVRMVVQRAGNGGYGVPGFPCDVLDRQQLHPPFLKGCNRYRERSRKRFQLLLLLIIHLRVRNLQEGFGNFGKLI